MRDKEEEKMATANTRAASSVVAAEYRSITVFGATGKTGSELIKFLSGASVKCRAVTRDIRNATAMPFVEWVECNLADKERLHALMKGCERVYLASNATELEKNAIEAAKESGVEHVVLLSAYPSSPDSEFSFYRALADVEETLMHSGLQWTILKPGGFMQNWIYLGDFAETVRKEKRIYGGGGEDRIAFIDTRDIAEVAFTVLAHPEAHINKSHVLTGSKAYSHIEIARAVSDAIEEEVVYVPESPGWYRSPFLNLSENEPLITGAVKEILGRPPRSVEQFFKDYADQFK